MVIYSPYVCQISDITRGVNTVITTSVNHGFVVGNQVNFLIPQQWGIGELSNVKGIVLATTANTVTVNINSANFSPFVTPASYYEYPQIIPVGDQNTGYLSPGGVPPTQQVIPGSFESSLT